LLFLANVNCKLNRFVVNLTRFPAMKKLF